MYSGGSYLISSFTSWYFLSQHRLRISFIFLITFAANTKMSDEVTKGAPDHTMGDDSNPVPLQMGNMPPQNFQRTTGMTNITAALKNIEEEKERQAATNPIAIAGPNIRVPVNELAPSMRSKEEIYKLFSEHGKQL